MVPIVGKTYMIQFIDRSYPCHCPCHQGLAMHIVPCCWDKSYSGPAKCVGKPQFLPTWAEEDRNQYWLFEPNPYRTLLIHESSIISEVT